MENQEFVILILIAVLMFTATTLFEKWRSSAQVRGALLKLLRISSHYSETEEYRATLTHDACIQALQVLKDCGYIKDYTVRYRRSPDSIEYIVTEHSPS